MMMFTTKAGWGMADCAATEIVVVIATAASAKEEIKRELF